MLRRGNIPRAPFSRERPGNPGGGSVGGTPPPPPQRHRSNQPRGPASPVSVSVGEAAPPQHGGDLGTHVRPRRPPALSRKRGGDGASATVARGQRHARRALLRGPSPARLCPSLLGTDPAQPPRGLCRGDGQRPSPRSLGRRPGGTSVSCSFDVEKRSRPPDGTPWAGDAGGGCGGAGGAGSSSLSSPVP